MSSKPGDLLKIAIFHDYFGAVGGGEKTVLAMADILKADIYTTDTEALSVLRPTVPVHTLGATIKTPPVKQISASIKFRHADIRDEYDFFIFTGNWSVHAAKRHKPNLWYCFTPVRAFHDLYPVFLARQSRFEQAMFRLWAGVHRSWNHRSVMEVDRVVSISKTVADRVKKYHCRGSDVIYPPVDTTRYSNKTYGDFWLSVNRLYPEKRIEMQIECFRRLPEETLLIAGGYAAGDHASRYVRKISRDLPDNVKLIGEIPEQDLLDLYATCKGHITTAMDEDYGLTPVEAMASGKPVVAVNEGGFRETVTKETGMLVPASVVLLTEAVKSISSEPERFCKPCLERAKMFDLKSFDMAIKNLVQNSL